MSYDLDAELEALRPPPIKWRGREWTLTNGIPMSLVEATESLDDDDSFGYMLAAVAAILSTTVDELRALNPTDRELGLIMDRVREVGVKQGESSASPGSSASGEAPSEPTSDASTG